MLAVPAMLNASLIARLDRVGPSGNEIAQVGAVLGREFGQAPAEPALVITVSCAYYRAMLINDLADIDNEVFVFLDDYHLVTDPGIRRAVSFLLRHAPSHLHLVLTTRLEPPLSLGGLLAKNRLLEVDASVLRFDYSSARPISSRGACLHPPRADGTVRDV